MDDFQSAIGYKFRDAGLLAEALTAPAYRMDRPEATDNQRLEFLGDAALGLLAAERLFGEFPEEPEGSLTVRRARMVSAVALYAAADRLGLAAHLKRNKAAKPLPRGSKTLADAVEAIIGAAYIDGGLDAARQVFEALELEANAANDDWSANPKGELQVRAQAMRPPQHPRYELLSIAGKAHEPVFTVRVVVDGLGTATATAGSRKEAESHAAAQLLSRSQGA